VCAERSSALQGRCDSKLRTVVTSGVTTGYTLAAVGPFIGGLDGAGQGGRRG